MSSEPPASDQTFAFWPPGPTSSMSMSSGHVFEAPTMTRLTSVIDALEPLTMQGDGYGTPFPESGIVIAAPHRTPPGAADVSRGEAELAPAPALTARIRPKRTVPVSRTENSVTRRPSGRADVLLPLPTR